MSRDGYREPRLPGAMLRVWLGRLRTRLRRAVGPFGGACILVPALEPVSTWHFVGAYRYPLGPGWVPNVPCPPIRPPVPPPC